MPDEPATPPEPPAAPPPAEPDALGEAGKRALEEERNARKTAEKAAKAAQTELDKLREASMSEQEKAVAQARAEGRSEAFTQANERLLKAEIRAAAAGKLADPADAVHMLDVPSFMDEKTGEIDVKAIGLAIDKLVQTKPYLSAKPGAGSAMGGPRGTAPAAPIDPIRALYAAKQNGG